MTLVETVKASIYSPEFYKELRDKRLGFSLKYFYSLVIPLALILTVVFAVQVVPKFFQFLRELRPTLSQIYPADLIIQIQDGRASVNQPEPYSIPLPEFLRSNIGREKGTENLLVIDTETPFSIQQMAEYKTLIWLSSDSVYFSQESSGVRAESLSRFPDGTLDKALALSLADQATNLSRWVVPFMVLAILLFMFLGLVFGASVNLLYLFLGALLVWLVSVLRRDNLGYWASYRLSIHLMTLGILFEAFTLLVRLSQPPFVFTALLLVMAWINLRPAPERPAAGK